MFFFFLCLIVCNAAGFTPRFAGSVSFSLSLSVSLSLFLSFFLSFFLLSFFFSYFLSFLSFFRSFFLAVRVVCYDMHASLCDFALARCFVHFYAWVLMGVR